MVEIYMFRKNVLIVNFSGPKICQKAAVGITSHADPDQTAPQCTHSICQSSRKEGVLRIIQR